MGVTGARIFALNSGEERALSGSGGTGGIGEEPRDRAGVVGGECGTETEVVRRCWCPSLGERYGLGAATVSGDCGSRFERVRRLRVWTTESRLRWSKERDWTRVRGGASPGGTSGELARCWRRLSRAERCGEGRGVWMGSGEGSLGGGESGRSKNDMLAGWWLALSNPARLYMHTHPARQMKIGLIQISDLDRHAPSIYVALPCISDNNLSHIQSWSFLFQFPPLQPTPLAVLSFDFYHYRSTLTTTTRPSSFILSRIISD